MGHGGQFWQNVVHWRREWQTTSVFFPWELHESMKRQKDRTLKDELPRSVDAQYATGEEWRNNSRKRWSQSKNSAQLWMWLVIELKSEAVKNNIALEPGIRSMNQGKLEVVKQEMARVNIDILGINELKWTGMVEFNLDNHYIYYCGQESLRRNGVAITVNKRVWNAVLGCSLKNDRMISVYFQGKPFIMTVIQVYAPISNAEEAEIEWFWWKWKKRVKKLA